MTVVVWPDLAPRDGGSQMALDHALLDLAAEEGLSVLRIYRWDRDTISFGANEAALRSWDRDRIAAMAVPAVRRPTGGRAVWHAAEDLTYSMVGPIASLGDLRLAYRAIHQRIAAGLEALGLEARLAPAPPRLPGLGGGACFDAAVGGEILINARKAIGSAQMAVQGAMLQHGEIARADRLGALNRFRRESPQADGATVAPDLPAASILAEAIISAWLGTGATLADTELTTRAELMSVKHLEHYLDPAWTWRR